MGVPPMPKCSGMGGTPMRHFSTIGDHMKRSIHVLALAAGLCICSGVLAETPATAPAGSYAVTNEFKIGGEGRWDYLTLDPAAHLLYVPRTTHTQVIDTTAGKVVGDIPGAGLAHGTAIVPAAGRGFISDGKD